MFLSLTCFIFKMESISVIIILILLFVFLILCWYSVNKNKFLTGSALTGLIKKQNQQTYIKNLSTNEYDKLNLNINPIYTSRADNFYKNCYLNAMCNLDNISFCFSEGSNLLQEYSHQNYTSSFNLFSKIENANTDIYSFEWNEGGLNHIFKNIETDITNILNICFYSGYFEVDIPIIYSSIKDIKILAIENDDSICVQRLLKDINYHSCNISYEDNKHIIDFENTEEYRKYITEIIQKYVKYDIQTNYVDFIKTNILNFKKLGTLIHNNLIESIKNIILNSIEQKLSIGYQFYKLNNIFDKTKLLNGIDELWYKIITSSKLKYNPTYPQKSQQNTIFYSNINSINELSSRNVLRDDKYVRILITVGFKPKIYFNDNMNLSINYSDYKNSFCANPDGLVFK